jgi:pyruvate,water dikinase
MSSSKLIFWLEEISQQHNKIVGKKCANLGEIAQLGMPIPPGFAISIDMHKKFMEETGAADKISYFLKSLGQLKETERIEFFEEISRKIRDIIENEQMPESLERGISFYYEELCKKVGIFNVPVSVRSAGIVSRPGMFETYLNVKGKEKVLDKVKRVWASAFTPRAITFRVNRGIPIDSDLLGVAVLKMVNTRSAGVIFTLNPINGDLSKIVIEANWGLGETVVSGKVTPDLYMVDKVTMEIVTRTISQKVIEYNFESNTEEVVYFNIPTERQILPCLSDEEVLELAQLAKLLEHHFCQAQDIEWAIDSDLLFPKNVQILQSRPETVWSQKGGQEPIFPPRANVLEIMLDRLKEGR